MTDRAEKPKRYIVYKRVRDIAPASRNPKRHVGKAIEASVSRFGFADPMVVDGRTGRLVTGHGRREALLELERKGGVPPDGIEVDPTDGAWKAPILEGWASKTDEDAEAFLLAANQTTEAGGWDVADLGASIDAVRKSIDLRAFGFSKHDLDKAIAAARAQADKAAGVVQTPPPERPKIPESRMGDLYRMGKHRLLVGDSTKAEDVARLMGGESADAALTDPPYAIYGSSSGLSSSVSDDKLVRPFFRDVLAAIQVATKQFGQAYVFCDWRSWPSWWEVAKLTRMAPKNLLVWDKNGAGLGSNWANTHELVGYFMNLPEQTTMQSNLPRGIRAVLHANVLHFNRASGDDREHNAAKPVDLLRLIVEKSTDDGGLVLDLFAGSGSTLIACESLGRRCVTMEIDEANADVTVQRWSRLTGKKAERERAS